MKLSKKLIAVLLTAVLVVAQVSVFPFADAGNSYAFSDKDDGAYYFWRVPNTQSDGSELPKNSAGRTYLNRAALGGVEFSPSIARDPETLEYKKTGNIFTQEIDGENFVELDSKGGCPYFHLSSQSYYNGDKLYPSAGVPSDIDASKIEAFAIRFKATGEGESGFELRVSDSTSPFYGFNRSFSEYTFIDAKTNEVSNIPYGKPSSTSTYYSYYINGEMDGWIIVPLVRGKKEDGDGDKTNNVQYTEEEAAQWLRESWKSVSIYFHGLECSNHSASFSNWEDRLLYIGDSMFLTDIDKFIEVHGGPEAPQYSKKTYNSITINKVDGLVYSVARADDPENILATNETGVFTGLEQDTAYTFYSAWKDQHNAHISKRTYSTDQQNPSLAAPEIVEGSLTDERVQIKVIPGLEYSLVGENKFDESGLITGLAPNRTYEIIGRNKASYETTDVLTITTLALDNPYDRGDGSSEFFIVPRDADTYYPSYISGAFIRNEQNCLNVVEHAGQRFVEVKVKEGYTGGNISAYGKGLYQIPAGIPRNIWLEDFYGFAFRFRIQGGEGLRLYIQHVFAENAAIPKNSTYYLIDSTTGTWTKQVYNGDLELPDFDGWVVVPFKTYLKKVDFETLQNATKGVNYYLRKGSVDAGWSTPGTAFYMGDMVVVEDIEKFISVYAPNTEAPIVPPPRNNVTDTSIAAVMMNDATGNLVGDGLYALDRVRANIVKIKKTNEESEALRFSPRHATSSAAVQNDALNYDEVSQQLEWDVAASLGLAFYLEVPEELNYRVHFGVRVKEDGSEYHDFGSTFSYITISEGKAIERYGALEFKPGFKGYVMLEFLHFNYDSVMSTSVDGMLNSPQNIDSVALTFDANTYPEMAYSYLMVDDFMLYQDETEFITSILKIQGTEEFSITEIEKTYRIDDCPELPRMMANDCTGIDIEDGIYAVDNIDVALVDKKDSQDSYINITIGKNNSSIMFENHSYYDDMSDEDYEKLYNSKGVSFKLSVPETAPMTVGMDMEILEGETEYFLYNPNTYYYTVVDGVVSQVYGYLEFAPGFNGEVIIPFENFAFDSEYSEFYDGELHELDIIDYFGFYFSTDYYASIAKTTISIDDIAFCGENMEYIDAIWHSQTKAVQ